MDNDFWKSFKDGTQEKKSTINIFLFFKKYFITFLGLKTIILKVKVFHNWGKHLCSIVLVI